MTLTEYSVGEVIELVRRPVDVAVDDTYREIGLRSYGNGVFHKPPVSGQELGGKRVFHIQSGDLVFSNVFAWEGAVALASDRETGMIGSHRFMTYKVNADIADPRYVLAYFYGGPGLQTIRAASPGSAGRNKTLGIKNFERQRIPLPDLAEQRRIADKLDVATRNVARWTVLREVTKQTSLALYSSTLSNIELWKPLGDGLSLALDEVPVAETNTYPMAGVYGFGRGLIDRSTISGSDTKYAKFNRLHAGSLVMSRLKAFEGAISMVPPEFDGRHVSHEFPTFAADPDVLDADYLGHLCRWPTFWALLSKESKGIGARRERVSAARLLATRVPFPDLETQRSIAASLDRVQAANQLGEQQRTLLTALRPALLNAAFSGQL